MSNAIDTAKLYIQYENYKEAFKLSKKRHSKDDIEDYLTILDLLIDKDYLPALEEKGMYYQYYDESHDNGDYGEKYFDKYLEKQPRSINVICDKALSRFNKNKIDEALEYMDKAEEKYKSYSSIEKPRISKKEVKMGKIELMIKAKKYEDALTNINEYEKQYGEDDKSDLYKGQMLQKTGENNKALEYLDKSLENEETLVAYNSKGDALYELGEYKSALKCYNHCISYEKQVDDLEIVTNFNYKAAFCCVRLSDNKEAVKYLNKTINMLNEHGRLPKDLEAIYQKCSFEKERIMKTGNVEDAEFRQTRFLSARTAIILLIIILIMYVILKMMGF